MSRDAQNPSSPRDPKTPVLAQLMPFNEFRFDDCMAYLAAKHNRALSVYEMMKLHVMIDVYHTLARGKPAIGGKVSAFTNGPVSRSSKSRVDDWHRKYERYASMPEAFVLLDDGDRVRAKPVIMPEEDDFSPAELAAMERAWKDVVVLLEERGFEESQRFFHSASFIGRAWAKARQRGTNLDWYEIIEEYDSDHPGEDHSWATAMLCY
jgi:hypothetical protein